MHHRDALNSLFREQVSIMYNLKIDFVHQEKWKKEDQRSDNSKLHLSLMVMNTPPQLLVKKLILVTEYQPAVTSTGLNNDNRDYDPSS